MTAGRCLICNVDVTQLEGRGRERKLTRDRCRGCYRFWRKYGRDKRTAPCPLCGARVEVARVPD